MRFTALLTIALLTAFIQARGGIHGTVSDEAGKPLTRVFVVIQTGSGTPIRILAGGDGAYASPRLSPGSYMATFSATGFETLRITGIPVARGSEDVLLNVQLQKSGCWGTSMRTRAYSLQAQPLRDAGRGTPRKSLAAVEVRAPRHYAAPVIDPEKPGARTVKTAEAIEKSATRHTADIAALSTAVYSEGRGAGLSIAGGRATTTKYVVDGIAMNHLAAGASEYRPGAGSLTSGEINDFSKWTLWQDMSMETLKSCRDAWPFRPEQRYTVIVKGKDGAPVCNARVKMSDGSAVWETYTDNTGKAELWYGMWDAAGSPDARPLTAGIEYNGRHFSLASLKPFAEGANMLSTNLPCLNPAKLDLAFIVDATGSMGDEISYLKAELRDILQKVKDSMPSVQVQTGAVFFRDNGDEYVTRSSGLSADFGRTEAFIADNDAGGGGDFPEAVDAALEEGLSSLHWRADATARLAFLVLDAPPHSDTATIGRMKQLTEQYAARGIRLIPVVCSGSDKPTEYLMRAIALATNGTYLFLTNHSGIGGSHIAPTTDKYEVEYLNGLIYRVIYQYAYMPACSSAPIRQRDTLQVSEPTSDSAKTISWRYYPNPTTGILHIEHTHTAGHLLVTDVTGKAILRVPADASGRTTIDLTQYPAGIYAVRYNWEGDRWVSGKFVLVH